MADFESLIDRWQKAGVLDAGVAERIRAWESERKQHHGLRWQGLVALILGAMLLACGVALFVSSHWDQLGPDARFAVVLGMVSLFHLGGALTRKSYHGLATALHAVGTLSTGAAIALVGQIFNIQEHWPAAVLMWAVAALFGWMLLQDEAQQTLSLLLVPAWILSEFSYAAEGHIGATVYVGRFLIVWATLYLTFFLGSKHKIAQGILFAAGMIALFAGVVTLLLAGWSSWGNETYLPLGLRTWGWLDIAALPLFFAIFKIRKSAIPVMIALVFAVALPWCQRVWTQTYNYGNQDHGSYVRSEPNLAAHAVVAAFAVFIIWWGVRQASKSLVNLGVMGFATTVGWFYFSNIMDKLGRSLGLIGLGILFLAGGWALERARRKLVTGMEKAEPAVVEAR
jgi:uncharacterized membrane protein